MEVLPPVELRRARDLVTIHQFRSGGNGVKTRKANIRLCRKQGHTPLTMGIANEGGVFTVCRNCGADLVHGLGCWKLPPAGMRVVWQTTHERGAAKDVDNLPAVGKVVDRNLDEEAQKVSLIIRSENISEHSEGDRRSGSSLWRKVRSLSLGIRRFGESSVIWLTRTFRARSLTSAP